MQTAVDNATPAWAGCLPAGLTPRSEVQPLPVSQGLGRAVGLDGSAGRPAGRQAQATVVVLNTHPLGWAPNPLHHKARGVPCHTSEEEAQGTPWHLGAADWITR